MLAKRSAAASGPRNILAESPRYSIYHYHEAVYLHFKSGLRADVVIGDFYGDPQTAYLAPDETYCVVAGCGLILYYLQTPFAAYCYDQPQANWWEWGRQPDNIYWIECVYAPVDPTTEIRFVVDPYDEARRGIYQLCLADLTVTQLC